MKERAPVPNQESVETPIILPFDVRYALQYREARMGKEELLALARNRFERESLYLMLKCVAQNPEQQRSLLESVIHTIDTETSQDQHTLRNFLTSKISELPNDVSVVGDKLAQLSRQGFEVWHYRYDTYAKKRASDLQHEMFILAHAPLIGLEYFRKYFKEAQRSFYILIPEQVKNESLTTCGYVIVPNASVTFLEKDFVRSSACIIDDVIHTGTAQNEIAEFWTRNGTYPRPQFETLAQGSTM